MIQTNTSVARCSLHSTTCIWCNYMFAHDMYTHCEDHTSPTPTRVHICAFDISTVASNSAPCASHVRRSNSRSQHSRAPERRARLSSCFSCKPVEHTCGCTKCSVVHHSILLLVLLQAGVVVFVFEFVRRSCRSSAPLPPALSVELCNKSSEHIAIVAPLAAIGTRDAYAPTAAAVRQSRGSVL